MPKRKNAVSPPSTPAEIRRRATEERNVSIALLYNAGVSASRLAPIAGVRPARIRQIAEAFNKNQMKANRSRLNEAKSPRSARVPT